MPLLRLLDVSADLGGQRVLTELDWTLNEGEVWAVTGPNGAGKSSLFKLVRGDLWPSRGQRLYNLDGRETRSPLQAKERMALVSPELGDWYATSAWALSGWQVVLSGVTGERLPPYPLLPQHVEWAREAVERTGAGHLMDQDVRTLSQGQRRRVLLARALAGGPQVLILDEFWEGVDGPARAELRHLVGGLAQDGLTLLYSTHRHEEFLGSTSHHLHLEGGRITRQERHVPRPPQKRHTSTAGPASSGEVVLDIERADVYRGDTQVLHQVFWQLRAGEHWAFLGANGAGKSTLARLVSGDLFPAVGAHVRRFDLSPRATLEERRRHITLVSAEIQAQQRREATGETVVASGFFGTTGHAPTLSPAQQARLQEVCARLGVLDLLRRPATELSHGQLKKLLFARAFVGRPRLLLLDEPFDYLDDAFRSRLLAALEELATSGTQLIFVVHRAADLPGFVTHALTLDGGRVVYSGPLDTLPQQALLQ